MSYQEVVQRVAAAAERSGRSPGEVRLVAVSKSKPVEEILEVYGAGQRDFGENRAQEMAEKAAMLPDDIRWHFVGSLQANKARMVRPITHLLHSMDRRSLAEAWAKGAGLPPPVLVEVNVGGEEQKGGIAPGEVESLLGGLDELAIPVPGLMAIPPVASHSEEMRPHFRALRSLRDSLSPTWPSLVELSMGMTDDFEAAIEEGATIIRVGRAIFGPRN